MCMDILGKSYQFIDLGYLKITCSGDQMMMQVIMKMFVDKTPSLINALNKSVSDGEWKEVHAVSHKLKSSFLTFGAKDLSEMLGVIESKTSEDRLNSSDNSFGSLGKLMNSINKFSKGAIDEVFKVLNELENKTSNYE